MLHHYQLKYTLDHNLLQLQVLFRPCDATDDQLREMSRAVHVTPLSVEV